MAIAGLSNYSSTSLYYKTTNNKKNTEVGSEASYGFLPSAQDEQSEDSPANKNNTAVGRTNVSYSRCITANIKSEEFYAAQSATGEMIYSYRASEQNFKIWIHSDGANKTYSVEGIDKSGKPFTKEFDSYDVNPESADFPEFAALCMYIRNTDETADMLANEYFAPDDILEKSDYMGRLQGFSENSLYEKTKAMMDNIHTLIASFYQIMDEKNEIDAFFEPFFTKYLTDDVDLNDYPDIAGNMTKELSDESVPKENGSEEIITPIGFGFANAGSMGYGMSAALVEKPGNDDIIIRVKIATGSGNETVDVNLSEIDPKNATGIEMFAYCQYKDAMGEGVSSKWGSWNALKSMYSPYDGLDFGSLDNIMNKKMDWSGKLEKSKTSWLDPKTNKVILSAADLIKLLEESHKLTSKELKEGKDWRGMSDDEWDKMLEGIDKYIDAYRERLRIMREMQEEAIRKAAMEADPEMKASAASSAALAVASGLSENTDAGVVASESDSLTIDNAKFEKNWTKKLDTDDQTVLMKAKEAQKMERMAREKIDEIANSPEYSSYDQISIADNLVGNKKDEEEAKEPLKLIAVDINGIRCINDETHEIEWEIKFNSAAEYEKASKLLKWAGSYMNNYEAATDEKQWKDFLMGNISEGAFRSTLKSREK